MDPTTGNVITAALSALPGVIAAIRAAHASSNPAAPAVTDAEALAALHAAILETAAKDDAIRARIVTAQAQNEPAK